MSSQRRTRPAANVPTATGPDARLTIGADVLDLSAGEHAMVRAAESAICNDAYPREM
jgi:hypothetical protein